MKAGAKPAAMSAEPHGLQIFPEGEFDALVTQGKVVKHQRQEGDVRRVIYTLPDETWRIDALLVATSCPGCHPNLERIIGALLGYKNEDVEEFIARFGLRKK